MKILFKLFIIVVCLAFFGCKKKERKKECVGFGILENIKDTVYFYGKYFDAMERTMTDENNSNLLYYDGYFPHSIYLFTKDSTYNNFIDLVKKNNTADLYKLINLKPNFSSNSVILTNLSVPSSYETSKIYSNSFFLTEDKVLKTISIKHVLKQASLIIEATRGRMDRTQEIFVFLIINKIDSTYKINFNHENIRCN